MHELSIAQSIIQIVRENLPPDRTAAVKTVRVKVGKLTNILTDSLLFSFDALTRQTELEGCELQIEHLPLKIHCTDCGRESELENFVFACPHCQGNSIQVVSGNELLVSEIELND